MGSKQAARPPGRPETYQVGDPGPGGYSNVVMSGPCFGGFLVVARGVGESVTSTVTVSPATRLKSRRRSADGYPSGRHVILCLLSRGSTRSAGVVPIWMPSSLTSGAPLGLDVT